MNPIPLSPISSFLKPLRCAQPLAKEPDVASTKNEIQKIFKPRVTFDAALQELNDHQYTNFWNVKHLNENDLRRHKLHQK